ncbi:MAG TPA: 2-oxoglutarate dehydrogenase, E2 component, dihydrolipoamide succinyltransferase [Actinomycetota bacterium]
MSTSVKMPQLGETVIEGTILKWLKKEGESIDVDEPLFEISTDKVDTEVPSPAGGTVSKILVPEGETVSVGTELAQIDDGSANGQASSSVEAGAAASSGAAAGPPAEPAQQPSPQSERAAAAPVASAAPASNAGPPSATPVAASVGAPSRPAPSGGPRSQILSPVVRKLAEENRIDLSQVQGTGVGGRITRNDVLNYLDGGSAPAPAPAPSPAPVAPQAPAQTAPAPQIAAAGEREEIVPMSHIRKAIATHMVQSLQTSARAWNMVEVDLEHVAKLRERAKEPFKQREGFNLTYMPFVSRAVCEALLTYPMVNAELRGEEIVVRRYVNLGIAVSIDDGLIVPVIKDADSMNLVGVARATNDVAVRARAKQLKPDEVHGGTFSITNPGPFGSILSVPIINQPQSAILAFDAVEKRPVVIDDAIAIRHRVYLSLSWDHRVIDGALASQFLGRVKQNLETWDFAEDLGL